MICIVGGALLLFWPKPGINVLCKISGIFLLIYGIAKNISLFYKRSFSISISI
ncbi:MAG: DUF308 domain-containing protein [Oribacterium sp.]